MVVVFIILILTIKVWLPIVLGPFLLHSQQWISANPHIEEISFDSIPDKDIRSFFEQEKVLVQKRFLHRGYFKIEALCSNSTGFLSFWVETDRKIVALFTAVESRMYEQIMSVKYTEFVTEFSDDTSTSTINSPQIESFQKLPEFQLFHFPEEHNISRLYQIHCKLLTLYDQRKRRVIPNEGREIAYIYNATLKRVIRQAEIGNYTYESATNRYRLTWLNAFRQTFRFCWPVFPILCKLDKRKSQKLLQKLNVSDQY